MVCLGTGTPRVYSTGSAEVVQIVTSPKGLICAVLTVAELQLWGAGTARVRLAVEKLNPRRDGAPLGLVWRADGLSLCVWSTKGVLLSFELALSAREWVPSSGAGSALTLNIHSHISYPSSGGVDVPDATDMFVDVASTKIVGKSVTRVGRYGRFTSVVADDDSLFAATDSGELLAFVWKFVGPASLLSAGGGPQPPPASASPHAPASHHPLRYVSDPAPLHLISVTKVTALLAQLAPPPPSLTPPTPSLMAAFSSSAAASAAASEFAPLPPANGAGGDEAAAAGAGAAPSGTPLAADSMASPAAVAATPPPNVLHIVSLDMPRRSHFVATVSNGSLTQFQLTYFSYGLPSAAVGDADTDAGPAPPSPSSSGGGRAASDSSSDSFTARTTRECAQQLQARAPAALSSPAGGGGGELAGCEHCSALVKGSFTHSLSAAGSAAEMKVRVNKKRGLLALTHGCKVVLRDINDPVHKVATLGMEGWGWRHADLGPVRDLVWSTDGAVLAVIYAKRGVAVFHWSGACLLTSLQRNGPGGDGSDLAGSGRTPPPTPLNRLSSCSALTSVAFDPLAYSLMLSYGDGGKFLQLALARSLTSVNPTANSGPHVVMCTATSVLLFSHPDLGHLKDNWDALSPPSCYTAAYAPLKYTAFSGDGNHCVVAGLKGCALYNTKLKRWRLWAAPEQEAEIELVCPPTWVSNVAVCLPVKRQPRASRRAAAAAAAAASAAAASAAAPAGGASPRAARTGEAQPGAGAAAQGSAAGGDGGGGAGAGGGMDRESTAGTDSDGALLSQAENMARSHSSSFLLSKVPTFSMQPAAGYYKDFYGHPCTDVPDTSNGRRGEAEPPGYGLVFYPRFHLDRSALLLDVQLPNKPILVDCVSCSQSGSDGCVSIVVLDETRKILCLRVEVKVDSIAKPSKVSLRLLSKHIVGLETDGFITVMRVIPNPTKDKHVGGGSGQGSELPAVVLLTHSGELEVVSFALKSRSVLARGVTSFWVDASVREYGFVHLVVSSAKKNSMVSFLHPHHPREGATAGALRRDAGVSATPALPHMIIMLQDADADALPIGILASEGLLISGTEGVRTSPISTSPDYHVHVRTIPYLHAVFLSLFIGLATTEKPEEASACEAAATSLARTLHEHSFFVDVMDYLVHSVLYLQDVVESRLHNVERSAVLRVVLRFLSRYQEFFPILVHSLRKADPGMWSLIFRQCPPLLLFRGAVCIGKITESAMLLRVLQMPQDDDPSKELVVAAEAANTLFPLTVSRHTFQLSAEVLRFLSLLSGEISCKIPGEADVVEEGRSMLRRGEVFSLVSMLELLGIDRAAFMRRHNAEEYLSPSSDHRWVPDVFTELHRQFGLPLSGFFREIAPPAGAARMSRDERAESVIAKIAGCSRVFSQWKHHTAAKEPALRMAAHALDLRCVTPTLIHLLLVPGVREAVQGVMVATEEAGCLHLTLLLAAMLFDLPKVKQLVEQNKRHRGGLQAACETAAHSGYLPLLRYAVRSTI